jgi:hypothetical protein
VTVPVEAEEFYVEYADGKGADTQTPLAERIEIGLFTAGNPFDRRFSTTRPTSQSVGDGGRSRRARGATFRLSSITAATYNLKPSITRHRTVWFVTRTYAPGTWMSDHSMK